MRALETALRVQAARNNVTRVKPRKWPRPRYPTNERLYYYRELLYVLETVQYLVRRDLLPALQVILGAHAATRPEAIQPRTDAADTDIDAAFESLRGVAARAIPEPAITLAVQQAALRTSKWNGNELTKQVQQVAKINLWDDTAGLADHLGLFIADNVGLVKSLAADHLDDLKGIVTRGARQGLHHTEVADQIEARFGVAKKRAALIATDQIGKLNGELNQLRQQNLGVRRYRWSSSQDERVRPRHRELNGQVYAWNDPPVVDQRTGERGHPGQAIRCRCSAIPIIDDVLVDAGLMDPADVELTQPAPGRQPSLRPVALPAGPLPPEPPPPPPPGPLPPNPLPPPPPGLPQPPPANLLTTEELRQLEAKRLLDEQRAIARRARAAERLAQKAAEVAAARAAAERAELERLAAARQAAEAAAAKAAAASSRLGDVAAEVFGRKITDAELDAVFGLNAELPSGFKFSITAIKEDAGRHRDLRVFGAIKNARGEIVGEVYRVYIRERGAVTAYHASFYIDDDSQKLGLGRAVFNAQIDGYARTGLVANVELDAATVGRYVWTKAGFEWAETDKAKLLGHLRDRLLTKVTPEAAAEILAGITTPADVAGLVVDGKRIGKELLLEYPQEIVSMKQTPDRIKRL